MTRDEAKAYISNLTYEQKLVLNEFLKSLLQKRNPAEIQDTAIREPG